MAADSKECFDGMLDCDEEVEADVDRGNLRDGFDDLALGCISHSLHLAVVHFLEEYAELAEYLNKVHMVVVATYRSHKAFSWTGN